MNLLETIEELMEADSNLIIDFGNSITDIQNIAIRMVLVRNDLSNLQSRRVISFKFLKNLDDQETIICREIKTMYRELQEKAENG